MALVETLDSLAMKILLIRQKEKNFLLYDNIQELKEAKEALSDIKRNISRLSPRAAEYFKNIPGRIRRYQAMLNKFIQGKIHPGTETNLKLTLRTRGHELMATIFDNSRSLKNQLDAEVNLYKELSILLLWIALPIGLLFCIFLAEWILEPLGYVRKKAGEIMNGKLKAIPLEPIANKCVECDKLVHSINLMLDTIECKQEQLIQSEKLAAIGKVTAGIAHEINNPLNNINLTGEVLLEDVDEMDHDERQELIRDMLIQVESARDVVHHLLKFSGKKSISREKVDLAIILETRLSFLKNDLKIAHTKVKTTAEKGTALVSGHRNQLQQVLVNVILNAIQAMGRGGQMEIVLKTDKTRNEAILTIRDNGPGIPKEVQKHILEPFYTTKKDGTGLGLSVSYGIIKNHGGEIEIETAKDRGTTVKITLPLIGKESQ
jgi:signal transduction histidine kinase